MAKKELIINAKYPVSLKVMALIQCISHEIEANYKRLLKPFGISYTQLMILHELSDACDLGLIVNDIKDRMVDDSPNVSRSLSALEKSGLITKEKDTQDKRVVWIKATKEGIELHHEVDKVIMSQASKYPLNEEETKLCYELLQKF